MFISLFDLLQTGHYILMMYIASKLICISNYYNSIGIMTKLEKNLKVGGSSVAKLLSSVDCKKILKKILFMD